MAEPYLSEIRVFSFNFAPKGWAFCNGQVLPINQNQALFALIGTFYGGNGTSNFQLPNLQGRVPVHQGSTFTLGQSGGEASHTLLLNEMPTHSHSFEVGASGTSKGPLGNTFGVPDVNSRLQDIYATTTNASANTTMIGEAGGSQPHDNMQPYLVLNYCIALEGIFPSQN